MSEGLVLCLYLIHKGHLRHQENSEHLLVLIILSQMLLISDRAIRIFPAPVSTKAICVSAVCLLKHLKLVLPHPIFQHQSIHMICIQLGPNTHGINID
jgi:hypothetical protein